MQILVVSHFYPPIRDGGYAQLCAEVCAGLQPRGHHIDVLTSNYGTQQQMLQEQDIYRMLHLENDLDYFSTSHFFLHWYNEEINNDRAIAEILQKTQPDIVFIWGMYGLSKSIPAMFEKLVPDKVVYFISDVWPITSLEGTAVRGPYRQARVSGRCSWSYSMGSDHSKSIIYTNLSRFSDDFIRLEESFLAPKRSFRTVCSFVFRAKNDVLRPFRPRFC